MNWRNQPRKSLSQRFEEKYIPEPMSGCWLWTASLTPAGYGQIGEGSQELGPTEAHRVAYEIYRGPIPDGLDLDHICRNRGCVNPWHLEPVTRRINLLRGETILAANLAKTHCPQGHAYTPENTYVWMRRGQPQRYCNTCRREVGRTRSLRRRAA